MYSKDDDFEFGSFQEAIHGSQACVSCEGSGLRDCPYCLGDGWLEPPEQLKSRRESAGTFQRFQAELDTLHQAPATYDVEHVWSSPDLVLNMYGYAQCVFCNGQGHAFCSECEGSGRRDRPGFDPYEDHKRAFGYYPDYYAAESRPAEHALADFLEYQNE